ASRREAAVGPPSPGGRGPARPCPVSTASAARPRSPRSGTAPRQRPSYPPVFPLIPVASDYSWTYIRVRVMRKDAAMTGKRKVNNLMALAVLAVLVEQPGHRYVIAAKIRVRGKDRDMAVKWGSLYTVVQNLEKAGFL